MHEAAGRSDAHHESSDEGGTAAKPHTPVPVELHTENMSHSTGTGGATCVVTTAPESHGLLGVWMSVTGWMGPPASTLQKLLAKTKVYTVMS